MTAASTGSKSESAASSAALFAIALAVGLAAWCSLGTIGLLSDAVIEASASTPARRIGLLPSWWLLPILVAAVWTLGRMLRLSSTQLRPLWASAIVLLPWLPIPVPAAFLLWTGDFITPVWIFALCGALLAGPRRPLSWWQPGWSPVVAAALALALYGASARQLAPLMPDGDAPHYLIIAQSLIADGDLKIENNHRRGDYLQYSLHASQPDFLRRGVDGEIYSIHAPGLPAIVVPAMWAFGYPGVVVFLGILAALSSGLVWWLSYRVTSDPAAAWFAWAASALTVPFFFQATEVFPDGLAATLLLVGTLPLLLTRAHDNRPAVHHQDPRDNAVPRHNDARRHEDQLHNDSQQHGNGRRHDDALDDDNLSRHDNPPDDDNRPHNDNPPAVDWRLWFVSGAALALLPWLQTRLAILAVTAAARLALRLKSVRQAMVFAAVPTVSAALWFTFFYRVYGTFNPAAPYGSYTQTAVANLWRGLPGILVDQQFGLLTHAPVYGVIIVGVVRAALKRQRWSWELLALVLPYTAGVAMYEHWWGGASVAARFLTPLTLMLAVGGARLWRETSGGTRAVCLAALLVSLFVSAMLVVPAGGRLLVNFRDGIALWLEFANQNLALPRGLPSLFIDEPSRAVLKAAVWALSFAAAWLVVRWHAGRARVVTLSFTTILCLCLAPMVALTIVWSIDGARPFTPARGELALLRQVRHGNDSIAVDLTARRLVSSPDLAAALRVRSDDLRPRGNPMVLLTARRVPAGFYGLRAMSQSTALRDPGGVSTALSPTSSSGSTLTVRAGDARLPLATVSVAPLTAGDVPVIEWPIDLDTLVVEGDAAALQAVTAVELQPLTSADAPTAAATGAGSKERRFEDTDRDVRYPNGAPARRAATYRNGDVFFRDDNAFPEPSGFWVAGGRRADVVMNWSQANQQRVNQPEATVSLLLRNAPVANTVTVEVDGKTFNLQLEPGEERRFELPASRPVGAVALQITSHSGFRPSAVEPGNQDFRYLGCWVELVVD